MQSKFIIKEGDANQRRLSGVGDFFFLFRQRGKLMLGKLCTKEGKYKSRWKKRGTI
jgi:hypothetical protein